MHSEHIDPVQRRTEACDRARILVVEADPLLGELLHAALLARGYQVTIATDPAAAMAALTNPASEISLVLSDYELPGETSEQLVEDVEHAHPGLPIAVIATGVSDEATARCPEVKAWFDKPFSIAALLDTVSRLTAAH